MAGGRTVHPHEGTRIVKVLTVRQPWASAIMSGAKTVEKKANRWKKGDLTGSDPIVIPVDAASVAGFTSEQLVYKLAGALRDVREVLEGKKDDPTNPTNGLIKDGEDLAMELHKLAIAR